MRILLVDDHAATRQEMLALIQREADLKVVAEADSGPAAIDAAAQAEPDLIVMDMVLPGMNGIDATRAILRLQPHVKVVALSNYSGQALVQAVLRAGGLGYVRKERALEELIPAIRAIAAGKLYLGSQTGEAGPAT